MTIVTLTRMPNGKLHVHEMETTIRSTFDRIVEATFNSRITNAAYLIGENGKMIDSYIK